MPWWLQLALVSVGAVLLSWVVLIVLARRLPPGLMKDLSGILPACASALWRLRRDAVRGRFERAGVPIAVWDDDSSLTVAMEEVEAFRRQARTARV